jgi:selT/selW/selH-like putative selenoprotein
VLKDEFDVDTRLNVGEANAFEVFVNGKLIFSKLKEDRFPTAEEIVDKLKK